MLRRDIVDRLQILVANRFREEQPERELTKEEIKTIWDNIYARLNSGETEKEVEEYCKTIKLPYIEEENNRNKVQTMWKNILEMLPHQPRSFDTSEDTGYWTNGSEILCSSELEREIIADFLEDIFSEWGGYKMKTGYYDPFEDARNGEQDDNTGFYYIDMEE